MHSVPIQPIFYIQELFDEAEQILQQHRLENPELYKVVEEKKLIDLKKAAETKVTIPETMTQKKIEKINETKPSESIFFKQQNQEKLKSKIAANQKIIHEEVVAIQSVIIPRTQARNIKQPYCSIDEMRADRENKLEAQIQAWRNMLPILIRRFSKTPDPRRTGSVKHKLAIVMLYGLFAFIFRLSSRCEINRELTGAVIFENLKKLFPELDSIPHADTIARVLEKINVSEIEKTHIALIYQLIRNKKFKKFLIENCLLIAFDGTQKCYRDGELQDLRWLHRSVGNKEMESSQQYVYILETNIVFKNGVTIPLL